MKLMRLKKPAGSYHHHDLRQALLQGALQLIVRHGPEALTLRAVAQLAGVSHAAPYRHFADKEALLAAVAEEGFRGLEALMAAAQHKFEHDPTRALEASGVAYVTYAVEHPARFQVMFTHQIPKGSGRHPALDAAAGAAFERLVATVRAGQAAGRFRGSDPLPSAVAAWSVAHGLSHLMVESLLPGAEDVPRFAQKIVQLAMVGVLERS
jgi:AcrR family transcriptional regulator